MNDSEYLKRLIALTEELNKAASAEPYDPVAYNRVIQELNSVKPPWESRRRRRPWGIIAFVLFLLYCLAWLIWAIFF